MVVAAIFAVQMLNPILGGNSAHFVRGAAGIMLGPLRWTSRNDCCTHYQCLVFGNGGINCLGANVWNMAIVDVFGYFVYRAISGSSRSVAALRQGLLRT